PRERQRRRHPRGEPDPHLRARVYDSQRGPRVRPAQRGERGARDEGGPHRRQRRPRAGRDIHPGTARRPNAGRGVGEGSMSTTRERGRTTVTDDNEETHADSRKTPGGPGAWAAAGPSRLAGARAALFGADAPAAKPEHRADFDVDSAL